MSDAHGVARDQLRAFIERIERLLEERKTIDDDIKDIYGEAKGTGFIPAMIKKVIALRKKDEQQRMEEEAILDTYLAALGMLSQHDLFDDAKGDVTIMDRDDEDGNHIKVTVDSRVAAILNRPAAQPLQSPRKAAEAVAEMPRNNRNDDAESVGSAVEDGILSVTAGETATGEAAGTAYGLPTNQPETADEMQHPGSHVIGNPEPALAAATRPNGDDGMVSMATTEAAAVTDRRDDHLNSQSAGEISAPFSSLVTREADEVVTANSEIDPSEDRQEVQSLGGETVGANTGGDHEVADTQSFAAQAGASVQVAPAANGVTYEAFPPMPMKTLGYEHCWPELSKSAYQCLAGDIALNGVLEPIVRMGDVIVDGWNRYNAARSLGIEYPVIRYSGKDVLIDVIGWQRSSRDWTPAQESRIAAALAKEIPHRANDIWAAFHLAEAPEGEEVAA